MVLVGASALLHALDEEARVSAAFSARSGRPTEALVFCSEGLRLPEQHELLSVLDGRVGGAVVLNVSAVLGLLSRERLTEMMRHPRFALDTTPLDQLAGLEGTKPARAGIFFLDHLAYFESRLPAWLLRAGAPVDAIRAHFHHVDEDDPKDRRRKAKFMEGKLPELIEWRDDRFRRVANGQFRWVMLGALIRTQQRRSSAPIVLVESTASPTLRAAADVAAWDDYQRRMHEFTVAHDVVYLNLDEAAALRQEDFTDLTHIGAPGARARYTRALADAVVPLMERSE